MQKMIAVSKFLLYEFLGPLVIEFLWLLFSFSFGVAILAEAQGIPPDVWGASMIQYGKAVTMVIFNAAALRIILRVGLDWLDKQITAVQAANQANQAAAKTGLMLLWHTITRKPIPDPDPAPAQDDGFPK